MTPPVLAQPRDRAGDPAILAPIGPAGPFADLHHQVAPALMKAACWLADAAGGAGVLTGLAAVRRGWRPHPGPLLTACSAVTLVLVFVPPATSVDVQNYAEYGRIVVLGHNPWLMTPQQLFRRHDPVGVFAPPEWRGQPTVYGPAAIAGEAVAAWLGGASMAWIAFWIKVVNGICFVAVAALLDCLAGRDQARRLRKPAAGGRAALAAAATGVLAGIAVAVKVAFAGPAAWKSLSQRLSSANDSFLPLPGAVTSTRLSTPE